MNLEEARQTWIEDRPLYAEFISYLKAKIEAEVKKLGMWRRIDGRTKEVDSLIKKLIVKKKEYHEIYDKAGVRVIVRFHSELEDVCAILATVFHPIKRENTSERYGTSGFGYQAIHYEVKLKEDDAEIERYRGIIAEIQVKSLSQNLWAEMAHELDYKTDLV